MVFLPMRATPGGTCSHGSREIRNVAFAAIHLWRNSALSEAEAPDTNIADQHLLMRAVLRLLESEEHQARLKAEATAKRVDEVEDKKRIAEAKLAEDEARLDADLLPLKDDAEKFEDKRKLLAGAGEIIAEQIEQLGDDEELTHARQECSRLSNSKARYNRRWMRSSRPLMKPRRTSR